MDRTELDFMEFVPKWCTCKNGMYIVVKFHNKGVTLQLESPKWFIVKAKKQTDFSTWNSVLFQHINLCHEERNGDTIIQSSTSKTMMLGN